MVVVGRPTTTPISSMMTKRPPASIKPALLEHQAQRASRYKRKMIDWASLLLAICCSLWSLTAGASDRGQAGAGASLEQLPAGLLADYLGADLMFEAPSTSPGDANSSSLGQMVVPAPDYANVFADEEPELLASPVMMQQEPSSQPAASSRQSPSLVRRQAAMWPSQADYESYRPLVDQMDSPTNDYYQPSSFANYYGQQQQQQQFAEALALRSVGQSGADLGPANGGPMKQLVGDQQQQQSTLLSQASQQQQQPLKVGPQFIKEPPSLVHYLNSSDLVIPCLASGNPAPAITWWQNSVQLAPGSLLDKRYVRYDNSLVISAFKPHDFEPEIHSATYRCQASNSLGTIVSRDVVINAVIDQDYEVSVSDQFVTVDNDALFKCQLAPQMRDLFQVVGWLEDGQHLISSSVVGANAGPGGNWSIGQATAAAGQTLHRSLGAGLGGGDKAPRRRQQQQTSTSSSTSQLQQLRGPMLLPDGQLYIPRVQLKEANKSYRCQMKNLLSGRLSLSSISGRLFVTDANENGASPRIVDAPRAQSVAKLNEPLLLTCLAQGSPRPTIRWFRHQASAETGPVSDWLELTGLQPQLQSGAGANQQAAPGSIANSANGSLVGPDSAAPAVTTSQASGGKYLLLAEGNLLLIKSLQAQDQRARFKCLANNSYGAHQAETELRIDHWPASKLVEVEPSLEFINAEPSSAGSSLADVSSGRQVSGQPASNARGPGPANHQRTTNQLTINCTIRASASQPLHAIEWLHNGRQLFAISLPASYIGAKAFQQQAGAGQHQQGASDAGQQMLPSSGYYSSGGAAAAGGNLSMFDDFNQELNVIEFQQLFTDDPATSAGDASSMGSGATTLMAANVVGSISLSKLLSAGAEQDSGLQLAAMGQLDSLLDASEELEEELGAGELAASQAAATGTGSQDPAGAQRAQAKLLAALSARRRQRASYLVWQSLRPLNKETLLYQLHFSTPPTINQRAGGSSASSPLADSRLNQLRRALRGSYQCRARLARTSLQATSQLLLRDNPPQFVETFPNQLIGRQQLNTPVSLKCVASGSPLPEISWTLSGFQVPESSRFRVGDYVTRDGLIVSFVNISSVQVEDGGLYECSATNDVGQLRHLAWLNVTGPAHIRPMANVSAIAGGSLSIMCPVGGWPIESIGWFQNSSKLPLNHRQKLTPNGTLIISELNEVSDSGQYSCQARSSLASSGQQDSTDSIALNHVHVQIKVPPVLEPFSFAKSLHRGQRYNIMCTVVRGDLPVSIRWLKDGRQIVAPANGQQHGQQAPFDSITGATGNLQPAGGANSNQISADQSMQPIEAQLMHLHGPGPAGEPGQVSQLSAGLAVKQLDPYSSTLTFGSLQAHHRGQYTCEATNEAGRANQSSMLVIHVPPEWRIEPKDLSVTVGRTAIIDCQADGFPAARVEWRLSQDLFREPPSEFKPIISSLYMRVFENGSLIIYNTQRTDAGYYLCQANNGVGPGISRVIKLTVHVAAHFKSKIRTELVRRGQAARLRCESIGDPPIEINWLKDKMPLYPSDEPRYLMSKSLLPDGILSELTIGESERADSALFTCITQNAFGSDDTNIQLIVQAAPDPPLDVQVEILNARSTKISWTPGHSGNSPLSKYVVMLGASTSGAGLDQSMLINGVVGSNNQQQQQSFTNISVNGNESSLLLQNLTPLTEYQFHLVAMNALGASRLVGEPIRFRTIDEAPSAPPVYVKAQALSSRSLRVRWRPAERRVHYGATTGFYIGYRLHHPAGSSANQLQQVAGGTTLGAATSGSTAAPAATTNAMDQTSAGHHHQNQHQAGFAADTGRPAPAGESSFIFKTIEFTGASNNHEQQLAISNSSSLNAIRSTNNSPATVQQQQLNEQECQLNGLVRGQKYLIIVQPFNSMGAGPASEPIVAETWRFDVPDPPSLRMVSRTTRSIQLAWRAAAGATGAGSKQRSLASSAAGSSLVGVQARALAHLRNVGQHQSRRLVSGEQQVAASDDSQASTDGNSATGLSKLADNQLEPGANPAGKQLEQTPPQPQDEEPIIGFILTRRQLQPPGQQQQYQPAGIELGANAAQPVELRLPGDHLSQLVDNLACGTRYQFTIAALNSVGVSAPSDPLVVKTEGSPPVAPDKSSLLSLNASGSAVSINLGAWHNGACQMRSFDILFKASRAKKWQTLTNYQLVAAQANASASQEGYSAAGEPQPDSYQHHKSLANQMAQRSAQGAYPSNVVQPTGPQPGPAQQSLSENGTILLDDLSSSINYDLKIVATNEAGTTEAIYTFNTLGHPISNQLGADANGGPFLMGPNGDQYLQSLGNDASLAELLAGTGLGPLLPLVLIVILIGLALSTGCILLARRRQASGSSCSLSISSASRSNQSTSNYYTTTTNGAASTTATTTTGLSANTPANSTTTGLGPGSTIGELQSRHRLMQPSAGSMIDCGADLDSPSSAGRQQNQFQFHHSHTLGPHRQLASSNAIRLGDIYAPLTGGARYSQAHQAHNQHSFANEPNHHSKGHTEGHYATSYHQTPAMSNNHGQPDEARAEATNGSSELGMCLGASALSMSQQQQLEMQANGEEIQAGLADVQQQHLVATGGGYYMTPGVLMGQQTNQQQQQQQQFCSKSSTLPSNCHQHQQIMQQLLQQQEVELAQQQQPIGQQQQLIESLVAANQMIHNEAGYNLQSGNSMAGTQLQQQLHQHQADTQKTLAELMLLEQQQQQCYATVKRGCPRPRHCDYAAAGSGGYPAQFSAGAGSQAPAGCCEQQNCYHGQQVQECQQTQPSDYQQLRPQIG